MYKMLVIFSIQINETTYKEAMMKKTMIVFIAILSTTVQAENSLVTEKSVAVRQDAISNAIKFELNSPAELMLAQTGENNSNLWEMLDTNRDGSLSKIESASSKEVFESWDKLDTNKDKKLDTEEFVKIFSQEN